MMRSEYSLRSEYVANLDLQSSRVLTRHACQQAAARQYVSTQGKGSMSFVPAATLCLAALVGILLSFAV